MYTGYGLIYFEGMDVVNLMMNEIILGYLMFELWEGIIFEYGVIFRI